MKKSCFEIFKSFFFCLSHEFGVEFYGKPMIRPNFEKPLFYEIMRFFFFVNFSGTNEIS